MMFVGCYFALMIALLLYCRVVDRHRAAYSLFLAMNMLACAVLFFPWCLHRETLSGFVGRMRYALSSPRWLSDLFALPELVINLLFITEHDHCRATARQEEHLRHDLYGDPT